LNKLYLILTLFSAFSLKVGKDTYGKGFVEEFQRFKVNTGGFILGYLLWWYQYFGLCDCLSEQL